MKTKMKIQSITITGLMSALICIIAPFSIPIPMSETPLSLGTFAVYLIALILGWKLGTMSILIYLLLGIIGIPVFTNWGSGVQKILGPTGGYLIGYLFIAFIAGFFADYFKKKIVMQLIGLILGTMFCYLLGTVWMAYSLHLTAKAAIYAGIIPYLFLDAIKIVAAIAIANPVKYRIGKIYERSSSMKRV